MDSDIELNNLGWGGGGGVVFYELCFLCLHATRSDVVAAHEANRYILFAVRRRLIASVRAILIK